MSLAMRQLAFILSVFMASIGILNPLSAQWLEAGVTVGTSNYLGDLVEGHIDPNEYNLAYGVFGRYQMSRFISFKGFLNKAQVSGSDANNPLTNGLRQRNLSFSSTIIELGIINEFSITPYNPREDKNALPYVFVGVSGFYFNPQTEFKGEVHNLRPLGTEGQGNVLAGTNPYSAVAFAVPFGFGFKWNVNPKVNIGAEFGFRITTTDYLDDVSDRYPNLEVLAERNPLTAALSYRADEFNTDLNAADAQGKKRGNPDNMDWFFIAGVNISVNLTDAYGLEWNRDFREFSEDGLPTVGKDPSKRKPTKRKPTKRKRKKKKSKKSK